MRSGGRKMGKGKDGHGEHYYSLNIPFHIPSLVTLQHKQAKTNTREVSVDPAALHNFEPHHSLHTS